MSEYGKEGKRYILTGRSDLPDAEVFVNEKYLIATIAAIGVVVASFDETGHIDNLIQNIAQEIYGFLKEDDAQGTEPSAD